LGPRCLADERLALCRPPSVAIERTGPESGTMVILSVIPQARPNATGPHHLDGAPDLTCEDGILRDGLDGCGSTSTGSWVLG
jgi:hypothetical protein